MDFQNILLSIVAIINFSWGGLILSQSKNKIANVIFSSVVFNVVLWTIAMIGYRISENYTLIWCRFLYVSAILIPLFFLYFNFIFPEKKHFSYLSIFFIIISTLILIFLTIFSNYIITDAFKVEGDENRIIFGPLYLFYVIYIFGFFNWSFLKIILNLKKYTGIIKVQLRYIFLGAFFASFIAMVTNLFLPWFGYFKFNWSGQVFTVIWVSFTSYAIIKYRLMDIRFVLGRGAIYFLSFAVVVSSALGLISLNEQSGQPLSVNTSGALIIIFSILLFQLSFKFFEKLASRYFFYTFYSYQTVLTELGEKLTRVLDLDKLSFLIVNTLIETMKLDRTVILLKEEGNNNYQIQKNIGFKEENGISLVKDNFLTAYMEKHQKPLVYEELSLIVKDAYQGEDKERLEKLRNNMKKIEAALCLPLLMENKITGMIVLGNKISGEPYSTQDINLLTALANQASISLQNAKLYDQVHDLSENLQEKVDEQTQELRKAYEELKRLDQAKSEFISIASHQLRTPLTTIKGYISMILEKSYGRMSAKIKKPLENINISNERLIKLVNDLLSVSRIEAGKIELDLAKVPIEKTVAEVVDELAIIAEKKKIYLKFKKAKKPLPEITGDKDKIRQVIINLIDNAIRYTNQGGITAACRLEKGKYRIEITDTGEGMTEEEISKLFESFSRGKAGPRFWTEGAGLGLYIAKKFVEMHQGRIWVESAGKNKGSTFYIELPINKKNL